MIKVIAELLLVMMVKMNALWETSGLREQMLVSNRRCALMRLLT